MTTYYKATFSNGRIETRSTVSRAYSHCYFTGPRAVGWAKSEPHARKAMTAWRCYATEGGEIAPAVEITAQEYRAMKKTARAE